MSRAPLRDSVKMWVLWAEVPSRAGMVLELAALPLGPSSPAHWTCKWVLPVFGSCPPGALIINYAEEMNQLDTTQGEPGESVAGLLP